jgi:hypothetical protein
LCFVRVTVLAGFCKSLRTLRADANLVNLPSFSVKSSVKGRFTPFRGSRVGPIVPDRKPTSLATAITDG